MSARAAGVDQRQTHRRVLIVQYSANRDGSAMSALMLTDGLRAAGWETHVAFAFDGPVIERYQVAGHHTHVIPHKNWLRSRRHLYAARNLYREVHTAHVFKRLMRQVRPDLVYINTSVSLAGALAAYWLKIPSVWHLRELIADVGGELEVPAGMKWAVRWVFRILARRLVVNSEAVAANVLGDRVIGGRLVDVVPNAVSQAFFDHLHDQAAARVALGLPSGITIIGVPGTLRPVKGHPFFFRAVRSVVQRHPALCIAVTGSGQPRYARELEEQVRELDLADHVQFLGSIRNMPVFYRACDLVCIPSVAEPFGRTVIEAFASGTPVIATAVGGIRETVTDGETGLLVPYGDEAQLAAAVERLLRDVALRERLCRRARGEAEQRYHEAVYQARLNQIAAEVSDRTSEPVPATCIVAEPKR